MDNIVITSSEDSDGSLCNIETVLYADVCSDNVSTLPHNPSFEFPSSMVTSSPKQSEGRAAAELSQADKIGDVNKQTYQNCKRRLPQIYRKMRARYYKRKYTQNNSSTSENSSPSKSVKSDTIPENSSIYTSNC